MKKTVAAATVAVSLGIGGVAGAFFGVPGLAGAAEGATGAVGWVEEALGGLVDDGTITEQQADAVETVLDGARPQHGGGHGEAAGRRQASGHLSLSTVAVSLGITEDELRSALEDGRTIADVADVKGVAVQTIVDAVLAEQKDHLDDKVAAGELTEAQADRMLADIEKRATAMITGAQPAFRREHEGGHDQGRRGGPGAHVAGHSAEADA